MTSQVFGQALLDDAYKDGLNIAQSNMQKSVDTIKNLNPAEEFKDPVSGKSYYTAEPPQTRHYQEVTQNDVPALEDAGRDGIDKNEATKEAWNSFGKPKIKIDPNELWLDKSNDIIKNAADITTATSSKPNEVVKNGTAAGINCKEAKVCRIDLIKKTCNEEANILKKICEKVPKITTSIKDIVYPNCQSFIITQHVNNRCPSGYGEILIADMVHTDRDHWDDIRFCTKAVPISENAECYSGGYYIATSHKGYYGSERATVPKKLHARIRISNVYFEPVTVTVTNETTGQIICNNEGSSGGRVIELTYSDTQDQTFRFYATQNSCRGFFCRRNTGVMVLYVDHIGKERVANLESWSETNCSES